MEIYAFFSQGVNQWWCLHIPRSYVRPVLIYGGIARHLMTPVPFIDCYKKGFFLTIIISHTSMRTSFPIVLSFIYICIYSRGVYSRQCSYKQDHYSHRTHGLGLQVMHDGMPFNITSSATSKKLLYNALQFPVGSRRMYADEVYKWA